MICIKAVDCYPSATLINSLCPVLRSIFSCISSVTRLYDFTTFGNVLCADINIFLYFQGVTRSYDNTTNEIIDQERFTKTEDHEIVIEKKAYELEHRPVEKKVLS